MEAFQYQNDAAGFTDADDRDDAMETAIDDWVDALIETVQEAQDSEELEAFLDYVSSFHDYSWHNTLLIAMQLPDATHAMGYKQWQEHDRHVKEGESAIWIRAPILVKKCVECGEQYSDHEDDECDADEEEREWNETLVGFRSVPVFDISQTEGEPVPELRHEAQGEAPSPHNLAEHFVTAYDMDIKLIAAENWETKGGGYQKGDTIRVKRIPNQAETVRALLHEVAHYVLHEQLDAPSNRGLREVEADATAYIVGQYLGLDMSLTPRYIARWAHTTDEDQSKNGEGGEGEDEVVAVLRKRLSRVRRAAHDMIAALDDAS